MIKRDYNNQNIALLSLCIIIVFFIYFRDLHDIDLNKYVLVGLIGLVSFLFLNTKNIVVLFCFLIPFFSGIAGNYILVLLLIIIFYKEGLKLSKKPLIAIAFLLSIEIFNNIGYPIDFVEIFMYATYYIFIIRIFNIQTEEKDNIRNILAFSGGTVIALTLILMNSLTVVEFSDLFDSGYRFGNVLDLEYTGKMVLTHDQNFIGYLVIVAIASLYIVSQVTKKSVYKIVVFVLMFSLALFGFMTSSRAFLISFLILLVIYLFKSIMKKNIKQIFLILLITAATYIIINIINENIIGNYLIRFTEEDFSGGRSDINEYYFSFFISNFKVFLIGTGLFPMMYVADYNSTIHNATLQVLVSYGVVGASFFFLWYYLLIKNEITKIKKRLSFDSIIPHIISLVIIQSIPFINPYYGMLPILITVFAFRLSNKSKGEIK